MEASEKKLFQMGEVTKAVGITRRMLINYEAHGLVQPATARDERGFRYYTVDHIVHIRLIRTLQNLGLSLDEIRRYFDDSEELGAQIERLTKLRDQIEQYIARLRLRQAAQTEAEVTQVSLPAFRAFCRPFCRKNLAKKTEELRNCYIEAVSNYQLDIEQKMCVQIPIEEPDSGLYVIPVVKESQGSEIKDFPAVAAAICVYYRGAYENFPKVHARLLRYAEQNGMTPHGYFRNIYMEGPPTHGANKDAYLTQIALPIKFKTLDSQEAGKKVQK